MHAIILLLTVVAATLSLALSRWLTRRVCWLDRPGTEGHKQHDRAVPNMGGIAIVAAVTLPMALSLAAIWFVSPTVWGRWWAPLAEHIQGLRAQSGQGAALFIAILALHVTGLIDDRCGLRPRTKLTVQIVVAVGLAGFFDMRIMEFIGRYEGWGVTASITLSALWIVIIINAMNMLDNMDGLSAGVGSVIAAIYLAATLIGGQWFVAALCALLLGALLGFLWFNLPPARLFMGDSGSLVVGLLLAVVSIRTTYYFSSSAIDVPPAVTHQGAWYGTLMPLVVMAVPLYDLVSVCWIRLQQGRSPLVGDQNHFSHRLVRRGMSRPAAVGVIIMATVATGLGGVMYGSLASWQAMLVAAQTLTVIAVLALLERKQ